MVLRLVQWVVASELGSSVSRYDCHELASSTKASLLLRGVRDVDLMASQHAAGGDRPPSRPAPQRQRRWADLLALFGTAMREFPVISETVSVELLALHALLGCVTGTCIALLGGGGLAAAATTAVLLAVLAVLARDNASSGILRNSIVGVGVVLALTGHGAVALADGHPVLRSVGRALLGLSVGYGLPWALRAIGSRLARKEVMGRGDVKAQAMIGAFLGPAQMLGFWTCLFCATIAVAVAVTVRSAPTRFGTGYLYCAAAIATFIVGATQ